MNELDAFELFKRSEMASQDKPYPGFLPNEYVFHEDKLGVWFSQYQETHGGKCSPYTKAHRPLLDLWLIAGVVKPTLGRAGTHTCYYYFEVTAATKYPSVHFDTFAYCNASCAFCGYPKMTRPKGQMDMALFRKVVDEIATWDTPVELTPVHYGEFFINPDWFRILQYIDEKLPHCSISIPTNGAKITNEMIEQLGTIKTLKYVSLSLYAFSAGTYRSLLGLTEKDFAWVQHVFFALHARRPDIEMAMGTTSNSIFLSPLELSKFKWKWRSAAQEHDISMNMSHGFHKKFHTTEACTEPFLCLVVLWDGRVSCCCLDPNGDLVVGDVNKSTLLEVWNSTALQKIRDAHNEGCRERVPLCHSCTCTKLNPRSQA